MLMSIVFNLSSIAMLAVPAQGVVFNWLLSAAAALITAIMMAMYATPPFLHCIFVTFGHVREQEQPLAFGRAA